MRAILLAAGMGKRLASASGGIAKALVEVGGRPLLAHQLGTLRDAGFAEGAITVVTGFDGEKVAEVARAEAPAATIRHNPDFRHQNLLSLLAARDDLDEGFLLCNVDHLMPPAIHRGLLSAVGPVVACVDRDRKLAADDMKVAIDDDGHLAAISKQLDTWDAGYIGLTSVRALAVPLYLAAADAVLAGTGPEKAVVEMVLGRLGKDGLIGVTCHDASGYRWLEVDTPEELARAEQALAADPEFFAQSG